MTDGKALSRRQLIMGGALLATAGAAQALVPRNRIDLLGRAKLEDLLPNKVGPWEFLSKSGLVVPPEDELSKTLYSQLLTRVYIADNQLPIMLLIAQSSSQDGVLQVHRPEVCYPVGGYRLESFRVHSIDVAQNWKVPTRAFTAVGSDRTEQLLYWTRIGSVLPTSWLQQRWAVAEANLRGDIPDAVLVRVSTISTDMAALETLDRFAREMLAAVAPKTRAVLVGSPT